MNAQQFVAPSLIKNCHSLWTWIPLLFSVFYFFPIAVSWHNISIENLFGALIIYIAFVYCYLKGQRCAEHEISPYIIAILSLAFIGTYFNPGTFTLFAFAAYFIGYYYRSPKNKISLLATLLLIFATAITFEQLNRFFILPALFCCIPNYFFGLAERKTRYYAFKEAKSQQQIEQLATVAERERIARDLHDLLGHTLSAIALKADLADKLGKAGKMEQALTEITQVKEITRSTLSEVRQAVSGYKTKDYQTELSKLYQLIEENGFELFHRVTLTNLTAKAESSILLIIKEAVTNILRHSTGKQVKIFTEQNDDSLQLSIFNDDQNNDKNNELPFKKSNGLHGIFERVAALSGKVTINNHQGFHLEIDFGKEVFNQ